MTFGQEKWLSAGPQDLPQWGMSATKEKGLARVTVRIEGNRVLLLLGGSWRLSETLPRWKPIGTKGQRPPLIVAQVENLDFWDTSLAVYLSRVEAWCEHHCTALDLEALPETLRELVTRLRQSEGLPGGDPRVDPVTSIGTKSIEVAQQVQEISHFVGECSLAGLRLLRNPAGFRWKDCLFEMQQCGAMALPIVSLVSFLVGVTLAYTGAIVLRLFGADIWVADLIGLSVTREMAAVMTGVVLAGRTGAAYAANLGNMKVNEEIDALSTLGVPPIDFLVIPRIVALSLMTPLLALYANCLGILGGMLIALLLLEIPPAAYWVEMLSIVDISDIATGLIKAAAFGSIIGMSGCLRGLQAERSAAGVGRAATSAVVTAIVLMVCADALFAVIFNILGW